MLIGLSKDKNYLTAEQFGDNAILCYNLLSPLSRPDAPLSPTVCKEPGIVTLAWEAPDTIHKGFTYEVFLKDEEGNLLNSTPAIIGGESDGTRKANLLGRVGTRTEWTFRPTKPGTYTWGVQAVDAAYTGSVFTEGPQFTLSEEDIASSITTIQDSKIEIQNDMFDLGGRRLSKPQRGVNIINRSKVLKK